MAGRIIALPGKARGRQHRSVGATHIEQADALDCYGHWPAPTMIHVDGPYGLGGVPGDPMSDDQLPEAYYHHIAAWSKAAKPSTTLWFWGTELGWATVHPLLDQAGWDYQELNVWNKGLSHVAGNVNSKTIRGVPVVTEVCARYTKRVFLEAATGEKLPIKQWVRCEWERSGVPLYRANEACGVKNAATRKYLTKDGLWYFPPAEMMTSMARYLAEHGRKTERPYFSLDGMSPLTAEQWLSLRSKWHHEHGVTNVWSVPPLHGKERKRVEGSGKALHLNQKPLRIIEFLIRSTTDPGDVVWDPFAGLASVGASSNALQRSCYCAEINADVYRHAVKRLESDQGETSCMTM